VSDTLGWGSDKLLLVTIAATLMPAGACVGTLTGGKLAGRLGRRKTLLAADFVAIVAAAINCIPYTPTFLLGRFLGGYTAGTAAAVNPLYINEYSPKQLRGTLGTIFQFQVTLGIFVSYLVALPIVWTSPYYWLVIMAFPVLIALVQIIIFSSAFPYETPYYLV
jgi:MFS family permease